ncbi:MAG TPA: hypothetical protein V6C95_22020 [Coleofasciculaceae cyanobacterium]
MFVHLSGDGIGLSFKFPALALEKERQSLRIENYRLLECNRTFSLGTLIRRKKPQPYLLERSTGKDLSS